MYKVFHNGGLLIFKEKGGSFQEVLPEKVELRESADVEAAFEQFKEGFYFVEAAGGLVVNEKGEYLFIFRNGSWDLPKGKLEKGEKLKKAAMREVEEECGIDGLEILERITDTYHTYSYKDGTALKITYWYLMKTSFKGRLKPQLEEGITKVEWKTKEEAIQLSKETFGTIREVLEKGIR